MMDTTLVWQQFHQKLHRYLHKNVACRADADDLLQEIFIKIHLHLPTISRAESLPFWVWTLTRNTLFDYWKKKKLPTTHLESSAAAQQEMEESAENINQLFGEFVGHFIDLLPEKTRDTLRLADLERISQKDLAEKWAVSYSGAKSRVQRARVDLENLFRDCCEIESDSRGNILEMRPKSIEKCDC